MRCIAEVDTHGNERAHSPGQTKTANSLGSGWAQLGPHGRKGDTNNIAAALAGAETPLAAADAAAGAPAAVVNRKRRPKPFRIPKRT